MQLDRYTAAILRYRWLVVALATLVMLALTAGVRFITVTNDYRILFGEDNPQLLAFDALENTYSASNTALIAIAPRNGSVFTREALGAVEELTEAAWRAPYSSRVNSLTNYTHSEALDDDLVVAPLVDDASSLSDADVARVEKIALNAIEIAGRLVSHDGRTAGVAINFILPENHDQAVIEITDYLNSVLNQARTSHPDIDYYMTGDVVMNRTFADVTKNDMETLTPIVFLIIVGATIILLRSILCTLAIVAMLVFVINTTMGFAGWNGVVFSPTNAGVPDYCHGDRHCGFDPRCHECFAGYEARSGQTCGDCRIDPHQCLSGIYYFGHDGDWIPQSECFGFAAFSHSGQLRGIWRLVRACVHYDAIAGIAFDSALACVSCAVSGDGFFRPLCRFCDRTAQIFALVCHCGDHCSDNRHSPH